MDAHTYIGEYSSGGSLSLTLMERLRHIAIVGATGSGKSTLLRQLARDDIARGDGLLLLDQHGDLAEAVLSDVPAHRHNHLCYLNLADLSFPVGLNVLEDTAPDDRAAAVDGVVSAMRSIWVESWGPRMEIILRHACTVLMEAPQGSLLLLPRLLTDDAFRTALVARVSDPLTRSFF
jgi:GTPase SAR1 family protein